MLRNEIFNALLKVQNTIQETQLQKYFSAGTPPTPDVIAEDYQKVSLLFSGLTEMDHTVLRHFSLHEVNSPRLWARIFSVTLSMPGMPVVPLAVDFPEISNGLYYFNTYLLPMLQLFRHDHMDADEFEKAFEAGKMQTLSDDTISLIVLGVEHKGMRPERITDAIGAVQSFYRTVGTLAQAHDLELEIVSMDSGRDKTIDLKGKESIITEVKAWIMELWDISVFYRERRMTEGIDWMLKTLKVHQQITSAGEQGRIGREQAHILKTAVLEASNKLVSAGAVIAEIAQLPNFDRTKAMAFERKLLVASATPAPAIEMPHLPAQDHSSDGASESYCTDEQVLFNRFVAAELRKSRSKKKLNS